MRQQPTTVPSRMSPKWLSPTFRLLCIDWRRNVTNSITVVENHIDQQKVAPVYILWGREQWAKKKIVGSLKRHLVSEGMEAFNYEHYYAADTQAVTVLDSCLTMPMMADRKFIQVEECQKWDVKQRKKITEYFKNPSADTCLVLDFDVDKVGKFGNFFNSSSSSIHILPCQKPKINELPAYIGRLAAETGLKLDQDALAVLADFTGDDIELMQRELDKLKLYKWGNDQVKVEDVEALTGRTRHVNSWEIQKTISGRNTSECLMKVKDILDSGESAIVLLNIISRYISQLLQVKGLLARGVKDRYQISQNMGMGTPVFVVSALMKEHTSFSSIELRAALKTAAITDDMLKGSQLANFSLIARLITSLLAVSRYTPDSVK
ncbi:MAG: DNA polymerase III subunit delta [Acidobacteria bacterium]|nr:MAG: DNA polymerase III subunit delta [Acidobacteriota bacterium]